MVTTIAIVVKPAFNDRGRRHHDRFDAYLDDTGELICRATRQPLLDTSRVLLARGCNPTDIIGMAWSHKPQTITMTAVIGTAAQFDVMGNRFVRRKPIAGPMPGAGFENVGLAEPRVPPKTEAPAEAPHKGSRHAATPPSPTSSPAAPASSPPASSTSSPAASSASSYPPKGEIKMPT
jgi:hypothetical protein